MSMILGLQTRHRVVLWLSDGPTAHSTTSLHQVGALLDADAVHPGRTGGAHLNWIAQSNKFATKRIDDLLEVVGLVPVADRRAADSRLPPPCLTSSPATPTPKLSCVRHRWTFWPNGSEPTGRR
jgi:hypothetical protein